MKYLKIFLPSAVIVGLLGGCKTPDFGDPVPSTAVNPAFVMFINAGPDAGSQPFLVDNAAAATVAFPAASPYTGVVASSELFSNANAKFGVVAPDTVKGKVALTSYTKLIAGTSYTLILTDTLARPFSKGKTFSTDQGGLRYATLLTDALTAPAAGNAAIRFFNLAPGAPAVYLTDNGNSITGVTASSAYRTVAAKFNPIQSGSHSLEVRTGSATGTIVATLSSVLADGKIYTIYLSGQTVSGKVKVPYVINVVANK